jgi:plastocyanin
MKTKILPLLVIIISLTVPGQLHATTVDVISNGFAFSPDMITIHPGDTVNFNIGSTHNAVEVSKETWDAGDTTSNGGFRLPFGGGKLVLTEIGTYYYVCQPHASLGMKGIITVEEPTNIQDFTGEQDFQFQVFPNPASSLVSLSLTIVNPTEVKIELVEITGRTVRTFIHSKMQPGNYTESFSLENLKPGRYMVHLKTDVDSKVLPLLIIE